MTLEPIPIKILWRVVNEDTGAEVVANLPHLHQSTVEKIGVRVGYSSQTAIATCNIPLHSPGSDEWKAALPDYKKLREGLKIEGFRSLTTAQVIPSYTYVIDDIVMDTDGWSISCLSTLVWLQKANTLPGEILASPLTGALPTHGDEIVSYLRTPLVSVWSDDFSGYNGGTGPHPSSAYTQTGWTWTASDPYEGQPAITSTSTGSECFIITNTAWPVLGQFWAGVVQIEGTVKPGTAASPNNSGDISVIFLGNTAWTAGMLVRAGMIYNGASWDITVDHNSKAASVYTGRGSTANVLNSVRSPFPFQLKVPIFMNAGRHQWGAWVNGQDSGLYVQDSGFLPASGGIGLRYVPTAGGSPQIWVNRLEFFARPIDNNWGTPKFFIINLTLSPTGREIPQEIPLQGQDNLSVIAMAAGVDGFELNVRPGRGIPGGVHPDETGDFLEYGPPTDHFTGVIGAGRDLTNSILLREGFEVVKATVRSSESFGADVSMAAVPATDTGGFVTSHPVKDAGQMILETQVSDVGQPGFRFLKKAARAIQARKASPFRSMTLVVVRTPKLRQVDLRPSDTVVADVPSVLWYETPVRIISVSESESDDNITLVVNDVPRGGYAFGDRVVGWFHTVGRIFRRR